MANEAGRVRHANATRLTRLFDYLYMNMKASAKELQKLKNIIETLADVPEEEWAYFLGKSDGTMFS